MTLNTILTVLCASQLAQAADAPASVTYHRQVVRILQARCQGCHRPGEIGPMSFLTYKETRPWAAAIKEAVTVRKMPPWSADTSGQRFSDNPSLSDAEIKTLVDWAKNGAPEGDARDTPPPLAFTEGWNIGKPDVTFEMPEDYEVPAKGAIPYTYVILPGKFERDTWIRSAEIRPGNRAVVHHVNSLVRDPKSTWLREYPVGKPFVPQESGSPESRIASGAAFTGYTPGQGPMNLSPGQGKLIKAGSDIVLQIHYTTNGKPAKDRTKIGMVFATEFPTQRVMRLLVLDRNFVIPPGVSDYPVKGVFTVQSDCELISVRPHMHYRGKAMEMSAVYPDGRREALLSLPHYDFEWQFNYGLEKPKHLPKGTQIEAVGHFDNSPNNLRNPDPKAEVRWGDQTWEEMMVGFFEVAFDPKLEPRDIVIAPNPVSDPPRN